MSANEDITPKTDNSQIIFEYVDVTQNWRGEMRQDAIIAMHSIYIIDP